MLVRPIIMFSSSIEYPGLEVFGKLRGSAVCRTSKGSCRRYGCSNDQKEFFGWWEICLGASPFRRGYGGWKEKIEMGNARERSWRGKFH